VLGAPDNIHQLKQQIITLEQHAIDLRLQPPHPGPRPARPAGRRARRAAAIYDESFIAPPRDVLTTRLARPGQEHPETVLPARRRIDLSARECGFLFGTGAGRPRGVSADFHAANLASGLAS